MVEEFAFHPESTAWELWRQELCQEWHGGHPWIAESDGLQWEDNHIHLLCEHCGVTPTSIFEFYAEDLAGTIGAMSIRNGEHLSLMPFREPVSLTFTDLSGWTSQDGWEYEFEVLVSDR